MIAYIATYRSIKKNGEQAKKTSPDLTLHFHKYVASYYLLMQEESV
jgi:hypothetical protein